MRFLYIDKKKSFILKFQNLGTTSLLIMDLKLLHFITGKIIKTPLKIHYF